MTYQTLFNETLRTLEIQQRASKTLQQALCNLRDIAQKREITVRNPYWEHDPNFGYETALSLGLLKIVVGKKDVAFSLSKKGYQLYQKLEQEKYVFQIL